MTDRELFIKALNALEWNLPVIQDYGDKEQLNIQHNAITALRERLAQPEQGTGNLLKDAYNAMVEKKTRSQKLREAGFTRRPKGWEKEKDEQETVGHADLDINNIYIFNEFEPRVVPAGRTPLYTAPPQRPWVGLTKEEAKEISLANRPYVIDMVAALEARLKEKNT